MPQFCPKCGKENREDNKFCIYCQEKLRGLLGAGATLANSRYKILKLLGSGGMGAVYLTEDRRLAGRQVAVKENLDTSWEAQQQFQLEATVLANLSHPNLPKVTDRFIEPGGRQYLVMEYIAGDDLETWLAKKDQRPLSEKQVLAWADDLLNALDYMHGQSPPIIHRDVKPANIKIASDGTVKLVDFGLSKIHRHGQVTDFVIQFRGTPGYAPIEQMTGGTDARSDIYSLGATLYRLLTGRVPPKSEEIAAGASLPAPRTLKSNISRRTNDAVLKAMAQRCDDRFQTAAEMRGALLGTGAADTPISDDLRRAGTPSTNPVPSRPLEVIRDLHAQSRYAVPILVGTGILVLALLVWGVLNLTDGPDGPPALTPTPSVTVTRFEFSPTPTSTPKSGPTAVLAPTSTRAPKHTPTRQP